MCPIFTVATDVTEIFKVSQLFLKPDTRGCSKPYTISHEFDAGSKTRHRFPPGTTCVETMHRVAYTDTYWSLKQRYCNNILDLNPAFEVPRMEVERFFQARLVHGESDTNNQEIKSIWKQFRYFEVRVESLISVIL
ncbi:hypothetical protein V6N13_085956 [Hibiscus sabdariffa]|uniref:Uncharacterized protein n=1 Tax=Hibiscus sabdariffa TaxID=183260 RepID=A0ABR2FS18_9ROSI